ncbi:hypothetical protein Ae201684P_021627 [Aphanomyces euteiches]|nr:hypothetical protein Ae201684P_021627 [Aphanomyces euteiches]
MQQLLDGGVQDSINEDTFGKDTEQLRLFEIMRIQPVHHFDSTQTALHDGWTDQSFDLHSRRWIPRHVGASRCRRLNRDNQMIRRREHMDLETQIPPKSMASPESWLQDLQLLIATDNQLTNELANVCELLGEEPAPIVSDFDGSFVSKANKGHSTSRDKTTCATANNSAKTKAQRLTVKPLGNNPNRSRFTLLQHLVWPNEDSPFVSGDVDVVEHSMKRICSGLYVNRPGKFPELAQIDVSHLPNPNMVAFVDRGCQFLQLLRGNVNKAIEKFHEPLAQS